MFVLPVALAIYATIDCARTPKDEMPGNIPKAFALIGILIFTVIGPLAWIVVSRVMKAEQKGGLNAGLWSSDNPQPLFQRKEKMEPEHVPPDNDPEFLWKLEAEIQRQKLAKEAEEEKKRRMREKKRTDPGASSDIPPKGVSSHKGDESDASKETGGADGSGSRDKFCD